MNRFMFMVTVSTAAIIGAHQSIAQSVLYSPPAYEKSTAEPMPFGKYLASRITDKSATEFRDWLANASLEGEIDISKGYTVFAVVDSDFDPSNPEHPPEHYIINNRVAMSTMHGNADSVKAINGDKLTISRIGRSYAVEGKRVNGVIKHPAGSIYLIGGPVSAFSL